MGYYGSSVYRGDYYGQGDYYRYRRGDPGFFDFLSDIGSGIVNVAKGILPVAAPIVGGLLGGPAGLALGGAVGSLASRVLGPGPPIPNPPGVGGGPFLGSIAPPWAATAPGTATTAAMIPASPAAFTGLSVGGPGGVRIGKTFTPMPGGSPPSQATVHMMRRQGVHVRGGHAGKRMNPLNPRALSRALRRARGFQRYAKKVLKLVGEKRKVKGFKMPRKRK